MCIRLNRVVLKSYKTTSLSGRNRKTSNKLFCDLLVYGTAEINSVDVLALRLVNRFLSERKSVWFSKLPSSSDKFILACQPALLWVYLACCENQGKGWEEGVQSPLPVFLRAKRITRELGSRLHGVIYHGACVNQMSANKNVRKTEEMPLYTTV